MVVALLADIHFRGNEFDRFRFTELFKIIEARRYQKVVIVGDLFDKSRPALEDIHFVYSILKRLSADVYLISGNHEAINTDTCLYDLVPMPGVRRVIDEEFVWEGVSFRLTDWFNIDKLEQYSAQVLLSHLRCSVPPHIKEEVSVSGFAQNYDLCLLGDIHARYSPTEDVHYIGSPYSTKFLATQKQYGYVSIDIENCSVGWKYVDIHLGQKIKLDLTPEQYNEYNFDPKHRYVVQVAGKADDLETCVEKPGMRLIKLVTLQDQEVITLADKQDLVEDLSSRVSNNLELNSEAELYAKGLLKTIYKERFE